MSKPKDRRQEPSSEAELPSESTRTVISLLLFCHLFCVAVVLGASYAPSVLQARLLRVLRPYTQTLNLDLDFTPYDLTGGALEDADHQLEILPEESDPADAGQWRVLPPAGLRGDEGHARFERLATIVAFYAEQEQAAGLIMRAVAENSLHQDGIRPRQVRCRRHMLLSRDRARSVDPSERNPNDARYFESVYTANTLIGMDNRIALVKSDAAGRVAPPTSESGSTP